ncbi:chloride channel protein [Herbaspirillum sp. WKF16]|uniref:chloride channel protein n=1 Tax=Herbaspirillum sp. WKF16 TaxID=3028312 RepID=UPI0023A932BA|nr:chloride channel protein [Herbaspirillum sp. WKF16]WDZ97661.1 chloride channel protein [Herbaspirillum sp. WKF16]
MRNVLAALPGHTRRHARRLWLQYGILWSGAVITGLVAVLYARLIDFGFELFRDMQGDYRLFPLVLTPAMGAFCVWATRRYFPGSEGSGIPQVIAALGEQGEHTSRLAAALLTVRIVAGKIGLSFLAILSGFTIGREGPTVQVGAALMYNMRRFYPRPSAILEKRLILAGAAAGLAAAFNTPLAGIVFAIEELSRSFEQRASGVVITAIVFAGVVALGLTGNYTYFGTIAAEAGGVREVIVAVILCGLLMGGAGGSFCWLLLNPSKWIPAPVLSLRVSRPILFGALCGLAVAVVGVAAGGATYGSGYAEAKGLLSGQQDLSGMYPLAKMAAMVGSYLPGIPGGIFAPSLSIGAGFGNLLHMLFGEISLPVLIALAMVGYLAAVTQSPITSFVIVMEMINGHALVIPLMATALMASRVSRFFVPPLYEALSERYAHGGAPPATAAPAVEPAAPAARSEAAPIQEPAAPDEAPVEKTGLRDVVTAEPTPEPAPAEPLPATVEAIEPVEPVEPVTAPAAMTEPLPALKPRQRRKRVAAAQAGGAAAVESTPAEAPPAVAKPKPERVKKVKRVYRQADLFGDK